MSDLLVRPALQSERSRLEALQWRASLSNPGDREALLANPDAIALPLEQIDEGHVFVAEQDGVIVGFAAVVPRQDGHAELDALFVDPSLWKRGVGRLLVDHCAGVARERSARILHVVGNPHAEGFYLACGFRTVDIVETRFRPGSRDAARGLGALSRTCCHASRRSSWRRTVRLGHAGLLSERYFFLVADFDVAIEVSGTMTCA